MVPFWLSLYRLGSIPVNRGLVVLDLRYLMTTTFATAIAWLNGAPPPGRVSAPISVIAVYLALSETSVYLCRRMVHLPLHSETSWMHVFGTNLHGWTTAKVRCPGLSW